MTNFRVLLGSERKPAKSGVRVVMDHDAPAEAVCAFNEEISISYGERYKLRVITVPRVRGQPIYVFFLATPSFPTRE